jgi:hypothetical protein
MTGERDELTDDERRTLVDRKRRLDPTFSAAR